jgi:hypothetical protein
MLSREHARSAGLTANVPPIHLAVNEVFWIRLFQMRFYSVHPALLRKPGGLE